MKLGQAYWAARGDGFQADFADAVEPDSVRRSVGEIDDAIFRDWAPVVDADEHALAVAQVRDSHPASEGEGSVRAGEGIHVEVLAGRCAMALKFESVPGGLAYLKPVEDACTGPSVRPGLARDRVGG